MLKTKILFENRLKDKKLYFIRCNEHSNEKDFIEALWQRCYAMNVVIILVDTINATLIIPHIKKLEFFYIYKETVDYLIDLRILKVSNKEQLEFDSLDKWFGNLNYLRNNYINRNI